MIFARLLLKSAMSSENITFVERLKEATRQGLQTQKTREEACGKAILRSLQSTFDDAYMESLKDKALELASYGWDGIRDYGTITVSIPEPRDENDKVYFVQNRRYDDDKLGSVSKILRKCLMCEEFDLQQLILHAFEADPINDNFQVGFNSSHDYSKHELLIIIYLYWGEKKHVFRARDD